MLPARWAKRLKMQESAQRSLCRLGFVVFAGLPTFLTIAWCLWSLTPISQRMARSAWENQIASILGVSVQIEQVQVIAPNRYRLRGIHLTHPETSQLIVALDQMDLLESKNGGREEWLMVLKKGRLAVEPMRFLVSQIHERWLCQPQQNYPRVHCIADDISIYESNGLVLESLHWESQFAGQRELSTLDCSATWKLPSDKSNDTISPSTAFEEPATRQPLTIVAFRQHTLEEPLTTWRLRTSQYAVPQAIIASLCRQRILIGDRATVQGVFESKQTRFDWDLLMESVQVKNVTWDQMTSSLPFRLLGTGAVSIANAYLLNGQIQSVDAILSARSGSISRTWLDSSQQDLATRIQPDILKGAITMVPFEAISTRLEMDSSGLTISGGIPDVNGKYMNSIVADGRGGIVYEPSDPKVTWPSITRWLLHDPFATSNAFQQPSEAGADVPVQHASHQTPNRTASNLGRWLTTVLPIDTSASQRR